MSLFLVAAMACLTIGCERHSASELVEEKGEAHPAEGAAKQAPEATAPAPAGIPANPSGSAPVEAKAKGPEYFPAAK